MTSHLISQEIRARLETYQTLLEKWQKTINLVAPSTLPEAWTRHFEDSLQIIPYIPSSVRTVYDLGSGAGFPGLVLAIARPDLDVHLLESDQRKGEFLRTISRETSTPVSIHSGRIEALAQTLPAPDLVTARALAPIADILDLAAPWISQNPDLVFVLHKGKTAPEELLKAEEKWSFEVGLIKSQTDPSGFLVHLDQVRENAKT